MRRIRKAMATLAAAAAVLVLLAVGAYAAGDVTVIYTNDVHACIDGELTYSMLAGYAATLENAVLVDAGDHLQGSAYGAMDEGVTITALMNAAGYDAATPGNHEFDYGMDGFKAAVERADFPYVSSNFEGPDGSLMLAPYTVVDAGGVKVAFVGIMTPETITTSTPSFFQDGEGNFIYTINAGENGEALYNAVQSAIDAASEEADIVIALGHTGDIDFLAPFRSTDIIANTCGLTAYIDGHSHSTVPMMSIPDKNGDPVALTQTGSYFGAFGKMTVSIDGEVNAELLTAADIAGTVPDPEVKAIEDGWIKTLDERLGVVIGYAETPLDNYDQDGVRLVRKQETNTGDFVTDALYYEFSSRGLPVDCAIMNGGGCRNKAISGELTYRSCKEIHTFGNVACLQTVTGQQILDALEWGARFVTEDGRNESGGFLQVSGITYTINTAIPSTVQENEMGVWVAGPTGEYRVTDVKILDRESGEYLPLNPDGKYNLAGYNYTLRNLGDGFAMFDGSVNILDYVAEDYMVLADYILSFPEGRVTGYDAPQGRIKIVNIPPRQEIPEAEKEDAPAGPVFYIVAPGDSLWKIAAGKLGAGSRWKEIYDLNRKTLKNPNLIYPGQKLLIP